jgi:hypothetical protein
LSSNFLSWIKLFKYNQSLLFCFSYLSTISTSYFIVVILEPYPSSTEAIEYFKLNLQPILLKGLTAMAKLKPASDTINAVVSSPIHLHLHIWKTCFETFFLTFFVPNCLKGLDKFLFHTCAIYSSNPYICYALLHPPLGSNFISLLHIYLQLSVNLNFILKPWPHVRDGLLHGYMTTIHVCR